MSDLLRNEIFTILESENGSFKRESVQLCTTLDGTACGLSISRRQLAQSLLLSTPGLEVALYRITLQDTTGFICDRSPVVVLVQIAFDCC